MNPLISAVAGFFQNSKANIFDGVEKILDASFTSKEEKDAALIKLKELDASMEASTQQFELELKKLELEEKKLENEAAKVDTEQKVDLIKTESSSSDPWVRRARPSLVYSGIVIALVEMFGIRLAVLSWAFGKDPVMFKSALESSDNVLTTYLWVWAGVATAYVVGRTGEKLGEAGVQLPFFKKK